MAEFVSNYGIWVVATFIALESVGIPLPAEAALIAAGFFAARTHGLDIWSLIAAAIVAAIVGEIVTQTSLTAGSLGVATDAKSGRDRKIP